MQSHFGGSGGAGLRTKFSRCHISTVFGKFWQNHMLVATPPTETPASAPECVYEEPLCQVYKKKLRNQFQVHVDKVQPKKAKTCLGHSPSVFVFPIFKQKIKAKTKEFKWSEGWSFCIMDLMLMWYYKILPLFLGF